MYFYNGGESTRPCVFKPGARSTEKFRTFITNLRAINVRYPPRKIPKLYLKTTCVVLINFSQTLKLKMACAVKNVSPWQQGEWR